MSNIALSWAYKCHVGNAAAKAVLIYLADRASDDGTGAFPKIDTIAKVTEFSESSVRKSLRLLQERGFIRKGDQRYARIGKGGRDRLPQYCQVVWDLNVGSDPTTLAWIENTHASEYDSTTMSVQPDPDAARLPDNDEARELDPDAKSENRENKPFPSSTPRTVLEKEEEDTHTPALHEVQTQSCTTYSASSAPRTVLYIKEETQQANPPSKPLPSATTWHLPDGETDGDDDDGWQEYLAEIEDGPDATSGLAESGVVADDLLRKLRGIRADAGLTTPEPTGRDRKAVLALHRRLQALHAPLDAFGLIVATLEWAIGRDWWARRIRTGRQLARLWDELEDDRAIEQRAVARHTSVRPAEEPDAQHLHATGCVHVRRLLDCGRAVDADPDSTRRHAHADQVLAWLDAGDDDAAIVARLADLLREERERHERDMTELARQRKLNGGHMFAGARERVGVMS
ncbi:MULTISPECIES: helix-turn-helix domain-containing protein [Bifidobacterium]|uniref:Zinc finger protein n=2 Tax=Bifidobacterium TaxID=1678 RepID=A0A261FUQ3_9BIFI|nr:MULTISPECIES: helix-turn-helix domain-containing protein [Bifidobacterium]OZG62496.1 zinc finger protein [Bifidobacterium lemurum]OZG69032.1 zinc finger protein [Bifidobacterium eulemuris]QOL31440.1 helix-turn-helix domain-containing protein [Bifidobacterium eulemuris]QOL33837.1 helix-turn-helix domain-containing protein [Bifidobacterium lemurum]